MPGHVLQLNISPGGLPKLPIPQAVLTTLGLEGDGHAHPQFHGGPDKAILLIASEVVDEIESRGFPVYYGALGENITTRGLAIRDLRPGDQVRVGGTLLEITKPRIPCYQLDVYDPTIKAAIYDRQVKALDPSSPRWGWSGFYAAVLTPGPIGPGDPIDVVSRMA